MVRLLQIIIYFARPILTIDRTEGMDSYLRCLLDIARTIVYEESLVRNNSFFGQYRSEKTLIRLHASDTKTHVSRIEVVQDGMALAVEFFTRGQSIMNGLVLESRMSL